MTRQAKLALVTAAGVSAAVVFFFFDPSRCSLYPGCPFHKLTGWWCPGCGATRSLHELVHAHWAAALRFNPLAVLLLPTVGYLAVRGEQRAVKPIWIWLLLGTVLAFGVLRNIPAHPFTLLAP